MVRAFVAIKIETRVAQRIGEAQSNLNSAFTGIRWVKPENLHLTLKFLGSVGDDKVTPIADALERALHPALRFTVACRGLGVFPDIRKAKVLWVGLEGNLLAPLAATVEDALAPMGFAREKRAFKPHLTVGRWRDFTGRADLLRREIERWREHDFGASRIDEVIFFQSVLKPDGAVYTPIKVFLLGET